MAKANLNKKTKPRPGVSLWWPVLFGLAIGGWFFFLTASAPHALVPVEVDADQVAEDDPAMHWLGARPEHQSLDQLAALEPFVFDVPPTPQILPQLGRIWTDVRLYELGVVQQNELPLASAPQSEAVTQQIESLVDAYRRHTGDRTDLGEELYRATVDDWQPYFVRGTTMANLEDATLNASLRSADRDQLTSPYRNSSQMISWHYGLNAIHDEVRVGATRTAYEEELKAQLKDLDDDWGEELAGRLDSIHESLAEIEWAGIRIPATLLRPIPDPRPTGIRQDFEEMASRHAERVQEAVVPSPNSATQVDLSTFLADYSTIREARIEAALLSQGWFWLPDASGSLGDASSAVSKLLYPRTAVPETSTSGVEGGDA